MNHHHHEDHDDDHHSKCIGVVAMTGAVLGTYFFTLILCSLAAWVWYKLRRKEKIQKYIWLKNFSNQYNGVKLL